MAFSLQQYIHPYSRSNTKINRILNDRTLEQRQKISLVVIEDKHKKVLSEDLIVEILSWLPVKTLLQFKCVCKSWYTIIKSSHFISKHIQNYYNNHDSECYLVYYQITQAGEIVLYELLLNETHNKVVAFDKIDDFPIYSADICGPCDGIYYLYRYWDKERALWNPALNEILRLPPIVERPANLPFDLYGVGNEVYGFGFDPSSKDYKVVVIQGQWRGKKVGYRDIHFDYPSSVVIYSTMTNRWRYWGSLDHNYLLKTNRCYVIVNGCCYWLGYTIPYEKDYEVIVCFDIVNEKYREFSTPKYGQFVDRKLAIHDDTIAFLSLDDKEQLFHVWTLDEQEGLWTKKYTIGPDLHLWNPVGHWKNNKILLQYWGSKLVICDTHTQEITDMEFIEVKYCYGAFVYKESLVSLKG